MTERPAPSSVIQAISRVMEDLPGIGKDDKADPAQGGYRYRGIEAITRAAQALFAKHGVVFVPRVLSHEIQNITVNNKPWTDTLLSVEYTIYGPHHREVMADGTVGPDDFITAGPFLAIGRDNSDKGANKCMTQAFKYLLLQLLVVSDAKDDGDQGSHEADAPLPVVSEELRATLKRQISNLPEDAQDRLRQTWKERRLPPIDALNNQTFGTVDKLVQGEVIAERKRIEAEEEARRESQRVQEAGESAVARAFGLPSEPPQAQETPSDASGSDEPTAGVPDTTPDESTSEAADDDLPRNLVDAAIAAVTTLPGKSVDTALKQRGLAVTGNVQTRKARLAMAMARESNEGVALEAPF
jgi:hypothetical protein